MFLRVQKLILSFIKYIYLPINYYFSTQVKLDLRDYKYEQNSVLDLKDLYMVVIILREIIYKFSLYTLGRVYTSKTSFDL